MNKSELKQKLKSVWVMQSQVEADCQSIQALRANAERITPAYSLAPGGSGDGQKLENNIIRIIDEENKLQDHVSELLNSITEVRNLISLVDDPLLRLILHKRYLNFQKWEVIAADLGYSWQHIHRIHSRALNSLLIRI
jgi:hypothetical protein